MFLQLFLLIILCFSDCSCFLRLPGSLSQRSTLAQCQTPSIKNGVVRMRQRGKLARFQCAPSYTLFGEHYSLCKLGRWEHPVPYCIKSGCSPLSTPINSNIALTNDDATTWMFCKPGYVIAGSSISLCDGKNWDRALGTCRQVTTGPSTWCDFETSDICGWFADETNDIQWKRRSGYTESTRLRVGPQYDHTVQRPLEGHYLITESSSQQLMESARLLSPIYPAKLSQQTSIRLYYYMYGFIAGLLRVYIRPVSIDMSVVLQDSRYKLYEKYGSSKNIWTEAIFKIEPCTEDFQIIIEATTGKSLLSDVAIDDFAIITDAESLDDLSQTTIMPIDEPTGGVYDIQSCTNRCDETRSNTMTDVVISNGTGRGGIIEHCDCFNGCEDIKSCCPDYITTCVFPSSDIDEENTEISENIPTIRSTTLIPNTDLNVTIRKTTPTATERTTIKPITQSVTKLTSKTPTTQLTTTTISTSTRTTQKVTSASTTKTKTTPRRPTRIIVPTFPTRRTYPMIITTTATTKIVSKLTTKPIIKLLTSTIKTTQKPETVATTLSNHPIGTKDQPQKDASTNTNLLISIFASIGLIVFSSIIGFLIWKRFRNDPTNYKSSDKCKNAKEEFSEIRFLTADEELDFTIQTPREL